MKILAIGNSFSNDATRFLHQIARADGQKWQVANLYIGGCSLDRHFRNMLTENDAYELQYNGSPTGFFVSLKEALLSRSWDVITLQQASHFSAFYHTYQPYLNRLADYIRQLCPNAKLYIHQTWAYEAGSAKLESVDFATPEDMFAAVESAYAQAAEAIGADGIIPSGRMLLALSEKIGAVHRDTYHASLGPGRYALALLWYRVLSGVGILENSFRDVDVPTDEETLSVIRHLVETLPL